MGFKSVAAVAFLASAAHASCDYTHNGLRWTKGAVRMNQVQVVGTHNSYHVESPLNEREAQVSLLPNTINYWYSHPTFDLQLSHQKMRNLEIDVLADPEGGNYAEPLVRKLAGLPYPADPALREPGVKVLHVPDFDIHSVCNTLVSCLKIIKAWLDAHPDSVPVPIMMELKTADAKGEAAGGARVIRWDDADLLNGLDAEIRSVFSPRQLITPDDLRRNGSSLEASVLEHGWPNLDSARGRIMFLMDNGPEHEARYKYIEGRPNLEGRVLFTNSAPGQSDCAFQKLNDPTTEELRTFITEQVKANYWVRTRADVPMETVLNNCSTSMRDAAFASGAHIVSTDFQAYGMSSRWGCDYAAKLPSGKSVVCNPVNAPEDCDDDALEPMEYRQY